MHHKDWNKRMDEETKRIAENFEKKNDGTSDWVCKRCGGDVLAATEAHSIHFLEMPGAGGGEVRKYEYPYCPKCDGTPAPADYPIEIPYFSMA